MDWIISHWQELFNIAVAVVGVAKLGAKLTPDEVDDNKVGKVIKALDVIGLVGNKTVTVKKKF